MGIESGRRSCCRSSIQITSSSTSGSYVFFSMTEVVLPRLSFFFLGSLRGGFCGSVKWLGSSFEGSGGWGRVLATSSWMMSISS